MFRNSGTALKFVLNRLPKSVASLMQFPFSSKKSPDLQPLGLLPWNRDKYPSRSIQIPKSSKKYIPFRFRSMRSAATSKSIFPSGSIWMSPALIHLQTVTFETCILSANSFLLIFTLFVIITNYGIETPNFEFIHRRSARAGAPFGHLSRRTPKSLFSLPFILPLPPLILPPFLFSSFKREFWFPFEFSCFPPSKEGGGTGKLEFSEFSKIPLKNWKTKFIQALYGRPFSFP